MLKIDRLTSIQSRGQFARLCVELHLEKPVVPQVEVRGVVLNLEYEGLHTICFHCGICCHREADCNLKRMTSCQGNGVVLLEAQTTKMVVQQRNTLEKTIVTSDSKSSMVVVNNALVQARGSGEPFDLASDGEDAVGPRFGPWMVVHKSRKNRYRETTKGAEKSTVKGGVYQIKDQMKDLDGGLRFKSLRVEGHVEPGNSEATESQKLYKVKGKAMVEVFTDKDCGPKLFKGPTTSKTTPLLVGRKDQMGPRFRDAKKDARGLSSQIKGGVLNGPKFKPTLLKENVNPSLSKVGAAVIESLKIEEAQKFLAKESQLEMKALSKGDTGQILQPTQTFSKEANSLARVDQPSETIDMEVSDMSDTNICLNPNADVQKVALLSEHQTPKMSI